ncbi:MAG TPA: bifunctional nuclease family protein [Acidimicrobiales bacterium]|nr:bifunctional nuclease family protein [Acidimicrobiales bacterium]
MTDVGSGPEVEGQPAGLDPGTWRLAVVAGVRMDLPGDHPEVLVHEAVSPWRELAIPVGMAEGNAIAYAWRGFATRRPLTHALFSDVLERHGVELEAVRITARQGRNFYAELDTTGPRGRQIISCRPSDALALVLRQRMPTPVLVADWVFEAEEDDTEYVGAPVAPSAEAAAVVAMQAPTTDAIDGQPATAEAEAAAAETAVVADEGPGPAAGEV